MPATRRPGSKRFDILLSLVAVVLCVAPPAVDAGGAITDADALKPPRIAVGAYFPSLSFPSLENGKPMSIERFHGKKTILHVFASW